MADPDKDTEVVRENDPNGMHLESQTRKEYDPAALDNPDNPLNAVYKSLLATKPQYDEGKEAQIKKDAKRAKIISGLQLLVDVAGAGAGGNVIERGESKPLKNAVGELERLRRLYAGQNQSYQNELYNLGKLNSMNWTKEKWAADKVEQAEKDRALKDKIHADNMKWRWSALKNKKEAEPKPVKPWLVISTEPGGHPDFTINEGIGRAIVNKAMSDPNVDKSENSLFALLKLKYDQGQLTNQDFVKQVASEHGWRYPELLEEGAAPAAVPETESATGAAEIKTTRPAQTTQQTTQAPVKTNFTQEDISSTKMFADEFKKDPSLAKTYKSRKNYIYNRLKVHGRTADDAMRLATLYEKANAGK